MEDVSDPLCGKLPALKRAAENGNFFTGGELFFEKKEKKKEEKRGKEGKREGKERKEKRGKEFKEAVYRRAIASCKLLYML